MRTLCASIFFLWAFGLQAQQIAPPEKADKPYAIRLGTYGFRMGPQRNYPFYEGLVAHSVAVSPLRRLYLGMRLTNFWIWGEQIPKEHYYALESFGQYFTGLNDKILIFGGAGIRLCNMAMLPRQVPIRREGQVMLSLSGGFDIQLYRSLRLELGYVTNPVLNKLEKQFGDGYMFIGLDWVIKKN